LEIINVCSGIFYFVSVVICERAWLQCAQSPAAQATDLMPDKFQSRARLHAGLCLRPAFRFVPLLFVVVVSSLAPSFFG
jgi:hypothetical protein